MKTAKRWCITFLAIILLMIAIIGATNYIVDPYGYFRFQGGDYFELNDDYYTRVLKAERIKHFADEYDAYIVGGSKASGIRTDSLKEYDGLNYYNTYIQSGNFGEYEKYVRYIFENDNDVKKILLHISSIEVKKYSRQDMGDTYITPAQVDGKSKFAEICKMLMKNLKVAREEIEKEKKAKTNPVAYPELKTGERNIGKYYDAVALDAEWFERRYVLCEQTKKEIKKGEEPSKFNFDVMLDKLFNIELEQSEAMELSLGNLRNIKAMCEENGAELEVVFGPSFVSEMSEFEGPQFWNFYGEVINIVGDAWDFSDFNDITLNPYNFYNYGHYFYDIGDLMVETMKENKIIYNSDDKMHGRFGYHVYADMSECKNDTSDLAITTADYLAKREKQYNTLKEEYDVYGTIELKEYDDESNLVAGSKYFDAPELEAREGREDDIQKVYKKTKNSYIY